MMHPDQWPPVDGIIPDEIVQRAFKPPYGRGSVYTYAVCMNCGTQSYEGKVPADDPQALNRLGTLTWMPPGTCPLCMQMLDRYPEIVRWIERVATMTLLVALGKIDREKVTAAAPATFWGLPIDPVPEVSQ